MAPSAQTHTNRQTPESNPGCGRKSQTSAASNCNQAQLPHQRFDPSKGAFVIYFWFPHPGVLDLVRSLTLSPEATGGTACHLYPTFSHSGPLPFQASEIVLRLISTALLCPHRLRAAHLQSFSGRSANGVQHSFLPRYIECCPR